MTIGGSLLHFLLTYDDSIGLYSPPMTHISSFRRTAGHLLQPIGNFQPGVGLVGLFAIIGSAEAVEITGSAFRQQT